MFDCFIYILININFFKDAILYFSNTIEKCPIEINDESITQLVAMSHVLKPIIDFINIVQRDFVPVGTVFGELLKLLNSIMSIDYTNDYHFKEVSQEKIILCFNQTCDYIVSELGFILTRAGHDWWQFKARSADSISFRLIQNQQLSKEDDEYIQAFNYEKSLLKEKLQEFAIHLHLNSDNVSKTFLGWLKLHDAYVDEPISYWNSNIISTILFNNEQI